MTFETCPQHYTTQLVDARGRIRPPSDKSVSKTRLANPFVSRNRQEGFGLSELEEAMSKIGFRD
jgi:hypothetical protein